jgi:nucleoside-diphosphate-sugar epimerase
MESYFITGATGYIGSMLVKRLQKQEPDAEISVLVREEKKLDLRFTKEERARLHVYGGDMRNPEEMGRIEGRFSCLIHCAAVTQSAQMLQKPVEVAWGITEGTRQMLELARRSQVKSMVYLSSMEVYGKVAVGEKRVTEEELGAVDLYEARSCYPLAKRMAEHLCSSYHKEYQVPVKTARLAQVFGEGILPEETRVFAQFIRSALEGKNLLLHTDGTSYGNYCEIQDALSAILLLKEKGENGRAYNVVNEETTMEIRELARLTAEIVGNGKIGVEYAIPQGNTYGYGAKTGLRMSSEKLRSLGWTPKKNLKDMLLDAARSLQPGQQGKDRS